MLLYMDEQTYRSAARCTFFQPGDCHFINRSTEVQELYLHSKHSTIRERMENEPYVLDKFAQDRWTFAGLLCWPRTLDES